MCSLSSKGELLDRRGPGRWVLPSIHISKARERCRVKVVVILDGSSLYGVLGQLGVDDLWPHRPHTWISADKIGS